MPTNEGSSGVSNCYVFKSRLQEFAQKIGLPTPVYETIKEGPSHEPLFRSTVIVNNLRYDSLPGFYNRKASEQSAAEIAILELAKLSGDDQCISVPVHETGLCKNLLQEYAQKKNYAIPLYECRKEDAPGRTSLFSCTAEIGGIRYIGAAAKTKKEAEIKAARTALLAIQSASSNGSVSGNSQLTVLPGKKREIEPAKNPAETPTVLKPKKARFKKKKIPKQRPHRPRGAAIADVLAESAGTPGSSSSSSMTHLVGFETNQTVLSGIQAAGTIQMDVEPVMNPKAVELCNVSAIGEDLSGAEPKKEVSDANPVGGEPFMAELEGPPTTYTNVSTTDLVRFESNQTVPTGIQVHGTMQMDVELVMNPKAVEESDVSLIGEDLSGAELDVQLGAEPKKEVSEANPVGGEQFMAELEGVPTTHTNVSTTDLVRFESNQTVPTGTKLPGTEQMDVELVMNPKTVEVSDSSPIEEDLSGAELDVQLGAEPKKEVSDANPVGGEPFVAKIEGALAPCTNGELQPLEGHSVASNGEQICNETCNAGEKGLGDTVKGQVAMEDPSATMAGSGESIQASVE